MQGNVGAGGADIDGTIAVVTVESSGGLDWQTV
jgi:hypothetical protein